jgi:hypothetical protein
MTSKPVSSIAELCDRSNEVVHWQEQTMSRTVSHVVQGVRGVTLWKEDREIFKYLEKPDGTYRVLWTLDTEKLTGSAWDPFTEAVESIWTVLEAKQFASA